jgi:hypothetical protein
VGSYSIQPSVLVLAGDAAAANYSITYINSSYVITHGAAKKLTVPAFSGTRVSGVAFGEQPVITIRDNGNNVIMGISNNTSNNSKFVITTLELHRLNNNNNLGALLDRILKTEFGIQ